MVARPYAFTFRAHEAAAPASPLGPPWTSASTPRKARARDLQAAGAASCTTWRRPSDGPHAEI